jgi:hypothetical protein
MKFNNPRSSDFTGLTRGTLRMRFVPSNTIH